MFQPLKLISFAAVGFSLLISIAAAQVNEPEIPPALRPWKGWVTWNEKGRECPRPYNAADAPICFWPSRLNLFVDQAKATWTLSVEAFEETWIPLPGSGEMWPQDVRAGGKPVAVLARDGRPFVQLAAGKHEIAGAFSWHEMPQRVLLPKEVGVLSLSVEGKAIAVPNWDADGNVWLKRLRAEPAEKDLLAARVYRVIEDGVPLWLRTEIELKVSGKSREESLGWILPEGWQLSYVESPLPVAIDPQGRLKARVRAGEWTIAIDAFRTSDITEFKYPKEAQPLVDVELVGWKAQESFRTAEISGIPIIDASQTTFPKKWRELPVYEWKTNTTFKLAEKMRGMGSLRPAGLTINRRFWLDDDGRGLTYRDALNGQMQQIQRLDAVAGEELGAVKIDGEGQLVTANPQTGAAGVEVRNRQLNMEAIGRITPQGDLPATGWNTDADSLHVTLFLPPGWRMLALFGPDRVEGDWLTAWTLLDLFLLLIFSLAVGRLWGVRAGIVALLAFGLAYHELGAPRFTWLFLLMPLALLRVVPEGTARRWVLAWKYLAVIVLALCLVPFLVQQIQTAIYPQLEEPGIPYSQRVYLPRVVLVPEMNMVQYSADVTGSEWLSSERGEARKAEPPASRRTGNLLYDTTAKIQTGPAEPGWTWNQVECSWTGPVTAAQRMQPILISLFWHRLLTVGRVLLLVALAGLLLATPGSMRSGRPRFFRLFSKRAASTAAIIASLLLFEGSAAAQAPERPIGPIPDQEMLQTLRERLLKPSAAFPHAAEIASSKLRVAEGRITVETEVHAAVDVAVPLPGRLPTWSPVSIKLDDGQASPPIGRRDGYLWVVVPQGVHKIVVEGLLAETGEWEWTFLLRPRRLVIDAPDWNVTGVRPDGTVETQVFFARKQKAADSEAAYDRKEFAPIVAVERQLEVGLVWKVRTTVRRLSSPGKAISLNVPLLEGESVLTSSATVNNRQMEVRLAAGQNELQWESELAVVPSMKLTAAKTDQWVERWQLVASAVWNVESQGLDPIYEPQQQTLIPTWQPWPGEEVTLAFTKPQAVSGDTVTVQRVNHTVEVGERQRTTRLQLELQSSLGSDFAILLAADAEITTLSLDGRAIPARREGANLIVPIHPGRQTVDVSWRTPEEMQTVVAAGQVSLPADAANITTLITVPESRWVLWAHGPQRGPAVRFWAILACAVLAGWVLGSISNSPLRRIEWLLLAIGLTQVHVVAALFVVGWLFLLALRGRQNPATIPGWRFNLNQVGLVLLTFVALIILVVVASRGLLGEPRMFIIGNGSTQTWLQWFQPRAGKELPEPYVVSISVWFYRYAMLFWALWLALALLRWLKWGWQQFTQGGGWKHSPKKTPPQPIVAEVVS